jgi:hypothetical protein
MFSDSDYTTVHGKIVFPVTSYHLMLNAALDECEDLSVGQSFKIHFNNNNVTQGGKINLYDPILFI